MCAWGADGSSRTAAALTVRGLRVIPLIMEPISVHFTHLFLSVFRERRCGCTIDMTIHLMPHFFETPHTRPRAADHGTARDCVDISPGAVSCGNCLLYGYAIQTTGLFQRESLWNLVRWNVTYGFTFERISSLLLPQTPCAICLTDRQWPSPTRS